MKYRIPAMLAVLAFCVAMAVTAGMTEVRAASFADVADAGVSEAVEVLSGLGIVTGVSDGVYAPDTALTRAQFCVLAVKASAYRDQVQGSAYRTLFSDLPASHWAASYVNLAQDNGLINGYGDGTFGPGDGVTVGQAVTVALRLLGYSSGDVGAFWPEDYLLKAADLGLTDGISGGASKVMTRGEAALLFYHLLQCETKDGQTYVNGLASGSISGAVILDNDAEAGDGTLHTAEVYANGVVSTYAQTTALSDAMVGRRGTLLLNKNGAAAGFVPDTNGWKTVSLGSAAAAKLTDAAGVSYAISSGTTLLLDGEATTYGSGWYDLEGRDSVTLLYSAGGAVDMIVASEAVAYDGVVLTGYYEDASPSAANPETITLLGLELKVDDTAVASLSQYRVGDRISVTLNGKGTVVSAGAGGSSGDLIGLVESLGSSGATVRLFSGLTVSGALSGSASGVGAGTLVRVSSAGVGKLSLSKLSGGSVSGALNVAAKKLGSVPLSDRVTIYDRVGGSAVEVSLEDIQTPTVASSRIVYAGTDGSGEINLLVLDDVTGNAYTYGVLHVGSRTEGSGDMQYTNRTVAVENSAGTTQEYISNYAASNGSIGGVAATADGTVGGVVTLERVKSVARTAFSGTESVVLDGVKVPVSDGVEVYNSDNGAWITLAAAKAYADTFTVYYSGTVGTDAVVRVVVIE